MRRLVLITNITGNPIYCDAPSTLTCLVVNTLQQYVSNGLHGLSIRSLKCKDWQICLEQVTFVAALFTRLMLFSDRQFVVRYGSSAGRISAYDAEATQIH